MSGVRRVFVEKKPAYAIAAKELLQEIQGYLGITSLESVRILNRYDIEKVTDSTFKRACRGVFAEPPVDEIYMESFPLEENEVSFAVEYLPGQFDQRADSAVQCIQFIRAEETPVIRTATVYVVKGDVSEKELQAIKEHCINPVDSRETTMEKPKTLAMDYEEPVDVKVFDGFILMEQEALKELYESLSLAMTFADFCHIQKYFKEEEHRNPTMTEVRVLDTYWSDHCRHTTFSTELTDVKVLSGDYQKPIEQTYQEYLRAHSEIFAGREDKFVCLMDVALMAMRQLKKAGKLKDQEESDEINACSIVVPIEVDGVEEEWLLNFKNETHNHPTEIEPFGGAATCLGGAIRDPLSGRTYVYQAMRVTGAADPTLPVSKTLKGKLPQKKLVRQAAHGYSSYGNQIGLATGLVEEIYHPDYVAKRMEIGAVLGASPRRAVMRKTSDPGDCVILLGGRTGRDGCGGATGSSKVHTEESIETCGAEVQKGNAPTERKIQRMFRNEKVSRLIKKCNDFGAGGVSVAIGELADGLLINLDLVPKKYAGLDGTEIAISESQERMAVVVAKENEEAFHAYAREENLEATTVAEVTKEPRLVLLWKGKEIVNLSRAFLDTNGAHQSTKVIVEVPSKKDSPFIPQPVEDIEKKLKEQLSSLNGCSQKGLVEMFDSSIGAGSVLMPYGGKYQMTKTQTMVAKFPVLKGKTDAVSFMSYGFDPYLSSWSPYHGAIYAVLESVAKIVSSGGNPDKIRFTFQEYFRRMTEDPRRYSQPLAALLGAYRAQMELGLPSIGGKDSMSGTFNDIDVPPTLVSFAVDVGKESQVISPELKQEGNLLYYIPVERDEFDIPKLKEALELYRKVVEDIHAHRIVSAYALDRLGMGVAIAKMGFGNRLGVKVSETISPEEFFAPGYGNLIVEVAAKEKDNLISKGVYLGQVTKEEQISYRDMNLSLSEAQKVYEKPLETVFPTRATTECTKVKMPVYEAKDIYICQHKIGVPNVFIPVFPGTNCEVDSAKAFENAGAKVTTRVFRNLNAQDIIDSVDVFAKDIAKSQIVMFPGGFSAGDEPDGSAKFFATAFQNEKLKESLTDLLENRDGLVLGICNGFQTLVKLGLVPTGKVCGQDATSPTLTYNTIGRHISKMVYTKVVSNRSPWLQRAQNAGVYVCPASHGEGRFVAPENVLQSLVENGQVATVYCDLKGNVSMDEQWNVNGSFMAIEGITSPDGRVYGKMAHAERRGVGIAKNIFGEQDMEIFQSGVDYFK